MTNLGAGFPVGSPETAGPPLPSSSGPPSERDRYTEFVFLSFRLQVNLFFFLSGSDMISCALQ